MLSERVIVSVNMNTAGNGCFCVCDVFVCVLFYTLLSFSVALCHLVMLCYKTVSYLEKVLRQFFTSWSSSCDSMSWSWYPVQAPGLKE